MASKDVLSLSLDDIIKLRGKLKRENSRGRGKRSRGGQERGAGQSVRGQGRGRGRGQGQVRGRGPRLVTSKFRGGIMRGTRGKGALATRSSRGSRGLTRGLVRGVTRAGNRRGSSILNGRGRGAQLGRGARGGGGGGGGPGRGGGLRGIRGGRGGLRGRATTTVLRRRGGGGGGIQRGAVSQQVNRQNRQENITARDTSFRQRLARRKIQQARKTLVQSQQNNRTKTRLNMVNARRGIQDGMRGGSGGGGGGRGGGSVVSLSTHHGLTVSIKNNIATKPSLNPGSAPRGRPRLNRTRSWQSSAASNYSSSSSSAMFTVVNDQALPPPTQTSPLQRLPNRRMLNRNYALGRDSREAEMAMAPMGYIQNNYSHPSPPEPHRQILDPKVQKEIAMLQGKQQVSMYSAPGPGVKGFRHIPSNTTRSLNERFTEERMITT